MKDKEIKKGNYMKGFILIYLIMFYLPFASSSFSISPSESEQIATFIHNDTINLKTNISDSTYNLSAILNWNNSLISWWRMDDTNGSSNSIVDYIGVHNGTAIGNAVNVSGKLGQGYFFDGNGDGIKLDIDKYDLPSKSEITMSSWVKPRGSQDSGSGTIFFIDRGITATTRVDMVLDAGTGYYWKARVRSNAETLSAVTCSSSSTLPLDEWTLITATANLVNDEISLYVNGVFDKTCDISFSQDYFADTTPTVTGASIGYNAGGGTYDFNGSIDDVMLFNKELSSNEIYLLYANESIKYLNTNITGLNESIYSYQIYTQNTEGELGSYNLNATVDLTSPILSFVLPTPINTNTSTNSIFNISSNEKLKSCSIYFTDLIESEETIYNLTINQTLVDKWDLKYPNTYIFDSPSGVDNLKVYYTYGESSDWKELDSKTSDDFFNGINVVRSNLTTNQTFVSIGFNESNKIRLKFNRNAVFYNSTAKYYDNRVMGMSLSNDNWGQDDYQYNNAGVDCEGDYEENACDAYQASVLIARNFNIPITVAVNTGNSSYPPNEGQSGAYMIDNTWDLIQTEINKGGFEPASHSMTHPNNANQYLDYGYEFEVNESKNLMLTKLNNFSYSDTILTYILTSGYYDDYIGLNASNNYLLIRNWDADPNYLTEDDYVWNNTLQLYRGGLQYDAWDYYFELNGQDGRYNQSHAEKLRQSFDSAYNNGSMYFAMYHSDRYSNPIINNDTIIDGHYGSTFVDILNYTANRKDVWYVANGWLAQYEMVKDNVIVSDNLNYISPITMTLENNNFSAVYNKIESEEGYREYYVSCYDIYDNFGISSSSYYTYKSSEEPEEPQQTEGLVCQLKFNENKGTTAYDSSGNNNHGTISGATWDNDGVLTTLVNGIDYLLNPATGLLTLGADYLYSWVSVAWEYYEGYGFHVSIIKIIAGMCALIVLSVVIIYLTKLYREEE